METHWLVAKMILRYIKGTLNLGLFYAYGDEAKLIGYLNSDWDVTKMRGKILLAMCSI